MLLPDEFLASNKAVEIAVWAVAQAVPSVDRLGNLATFPDRARTVLAALWVAAVPMTYFAYGALQSCREANVAQYARIRRRLPWLLPLAAYAFIVVPATFHFLTPARFIKGRTSGYALLRLAAAEPIAFALLAVGLVSLAVVFASVVLFIVRNWRAISEAQC
jgi:hypothetical protein